MSPQARISSQITFLYFKEKGLKMLTGIQKPEIAPVECLFFEGPGGDHFEVQRFLDPETAAKFNASLF